MDEWLWLVIGAAACVAAIALLAWSARGARRDARFARARRVFHAQRERLEAKFVQLAMAHASVDAPRWEECDFDDDVAYVRNRNTRELSAFVAVTLASADFAGVKAGISGAPVGTAVFRFDRDHWETDGKAILNRTPEEAIRLFQNDLEVVEQELAGRA
jgi:hypothetical protein